MPGRRLPPLHALRAFEAASRHGSMTRAADELGVTPGAISRHVRFLEVQMETQLFLRRASRLEPTAAGEALARSVGEALDQMAEAVSGARRHRLRRLSVGASAMSPPASYCRGGPIWFARIRVSGSIYTPASTRWTCCPAATTR